ncbi:hypothetical protein [Pedobacter sp. NJ-S-72]
MGWRLPTGQEWTNAFGAPQNWKSITQTFASPLKIHGAGLLDSPNGGLAKRGSQANYWSGTSNAVTTSWVNYIDGGSPAYSALSKSYGFSVRCLRDELTTSAPSVSKVTIAAATMTTTSASGSAMVSPDGGSPVTDRGLVWNTTGNPTIADNVIRSGAGLGTFNAVLTGLKEGPTYYVRGYATNSKGTGYSKESESFKICPPEFTVTHIAGVNGAPVTKTVTYHSVNTKLSGAARCWITQNLGADREALSGTDNSEPSSGWYWQFNRLQGYKVDPVAGRVPATAWPAISETVDWSTDNDPCVQLLSTGWRLPTETEWTNVYSNGWTGSGDTYASVLKIHTGGLIDLSGNPGSRGAQGNFFPSTSRNATQVNFTYFRPGLLATQLIEKKYGFTLRCLRDELILGVPSLSKVTIPASGMTMTTADGQAITASDGGTPVTDRGFVWNTTGNPTLADQIVHAGSGLGAITGKLTGLTETPTYYVRAFATNSAGTGYSKETKISFKICPPTFTISHVAGLNGAPETKTVTYHSVNSSLSGTAKCWITQDLGADNEAVSANDATNGAAGWYWQFNKIQAFKSIGGVRTPATNWISSISEDSNWSRANDPCILLLGGGWRIPTSTEYANIIAPAQGLSTINMGYATELKLHAAGFLNYSNAVKTASGTQINYYWQLIRETQIMVFILISMG